MTKTGRTETQKMQNQFSPNYASPPGETLQETLDAMRLSQSELSQRMDKPTKTINEIIKGKAALTPETALQLEKVLGIPASFWNNGERRYREFLARQEENAALQGQREWIKSFPLAALIKRGWIEKLADEADQIRALLAFFGVSSPQAWQQFYAKPVAAFRKCRNFEGSSEAVAAWLRIGEIEATRLSLAEYDAKKFRAALNLVRGMRFDLATLKNEIVPLCANSGVAVVVVPELPQTRVCGAARWAAGQPILQLSLRYKRDDCLCFAFFHEAAHILLHPKKEIFLECPHDENSSQHEREADTFAANFLIPPNQWQRFMGKATFTRSAIELFAQQLGVASGVVVGRLQHEKLIEFKQFNDLKIAVSDDNG